MNNTLKKFFMNIFWTLNKLCMSIFCVSTVTNLMTVQTMLISDKFNVMEVCAGGSYTYRWIIKGMSD